NPKAPSTLKVMAFGAGCLGRGESPLALSWWFKTMFAEVHLVEAADLDEAYIEQHRPDIVVAVSWEIDLPTPPER
ncbi:MAG: hypothetical protein JWR77_990, partial [Rhizorhabdus sp.]|nr:hypothetical protein [Rhizorhabdus sp.]